MRTLLSCLCGLLLILCAATGRAQQATPAPAPAVTGRIRALTPSAAVPDTAQARNLAEAFRRGTWRGRARSMFMATLNHDQLPDYYANGVGAGVRFETANWRGFRGGAGGFFWANLFSSDLTTPDPATQSVSRYEVGLFDLTAPARRALTGRPEELYLRYRAGGATLTFGRQLLNTPLLNPQDGRLTPTFAQGLWLEAHAGPHITLTAGWLTQLAPRSTNDWYSVAGSVGLYSMGVAETGQRAGYGGQVRSRGLAVAALAHQWGRYTHAQVWDYYFANVSNTTFAELTTACPLGAGRQLSFGGQYFTQQTVGEGGNPDPRLAYAPPGHRAHGLSARAGYAAGRLSASLNYTRLTRAGRFLFPREWGRDPFYTFLPRERNEGYGGLDAAAVLLSYAPSPPGWKAEAGYGHYYLLDVRDFRLNKYGVPAYRQLNLAFSYSFRGWAQGLRAQLLYVYKSRLSETYGEARYIVNKVDMHSLNAVLGYEF